MTRGENRSGTGDWKGEGRGIGRRPRGDALHTFSIENPRVGNRSAALEFTICSSCAITLVKLASVRSSAAGSSRLERRRRRIGYCVWTPYRSFVALPRDNAEGIAWKGMRSIKLRGRWKAKMMRWGVWIKRLDGMGFGSILRNGGRFSLISRCSVSRSNLEGWWNFFFFFFYDVEYLERVCVSFRCCVSRFDDEI